MYNDICGVHHTPDRLHYACPRSVFQPATPQSNTRYINFRFFDACDVVQLFHILHPTSKSATIARQKQLDGLDLIKVGSLRHDKFLVCTFRQ